MAPPGQCGTPTLSPPDEPADTLEPQVIVPTVADPSQVHRLSTLFGP